MTLSGRKGRLIRRMLGLGTVLLTSLIALSVGSPSGESVTIPSPVGLVIKQSPYSVEQTEQRFVSILEDKGLNVFATIDHRQNAEGVGLNLRPTRVVLFGNPNLGTPLMQCSQSIAIDLPQKMLIWEDVEGQVQIAYNDPRYLGGRHYLERCGTQVIERIAGALDNFSNGAIAP